MKPSTPAATSGWSGRSSNLHSFHAGYWGVTLSPPGDAALTADEALILDLFGCAQAEDYRALDERLAGWRTPSRPPDWGRRPAWRYRGWG